MTHRDGGKRTFEEKDPFDALLFEFPDIESELVSLEALRDELFFELRHLRTPVPEEVLVALSVREVIEFVDAFDNVYRFCRENKNFQVFVNGGELYTDKPTFDPIGGCVCNPAGDVLVVVPKDKRDKTQKYFDDSIQEVVGGVVQLELKGPPEIMQKFRLLVTDKYVVVACSEGGPQECPIVNAAPAWFHGKVWHNGWYDCMADFEVPIREEADEDCAVVDYIRQGDIVSFSRMVMIPHKVFAACSNLWGLLADSRGWVGIAYDGGEASYEERYEGGYYYYFEVPEIAQKKREAAAELRKQRLAEETVELPMEEKEEVEEEEKKEDKASLEEHVPPKKTTPISPTSSPVHRRRVSAPEPVRRRSPSPPRRRPATAPPDGEVKSVAEILSLFERCDLNRDGMIDFNELAEVIRCLDASRWTDDRVRNLLSCMDADKDRRVSYKEFVHWVFDTSHWTRERRAFLATLKVDMDELHGMESSIARR